MLKVGTGNPMKAPMVTKGPEEASAGDAYARCRTGNTAGRGSIAGWTPCPLCISLKGDNNTITPANRGPNDDAFSDNCIKNILSVLPKTTKSIKLFSHGRGLAAHLHAVHTPWNPGKAELKRRKALQKRMENERRRLQRLHSKKGDFSNDDQERSRKRIKVAHHDCDITSGDSQHNNGKEKWEPTEDEIKQWNQKVMEIVALVESEAKKGQHTVTSNTDSDNRNNIGKTTCQQSIYGETNGRDRSGNVCLSYRESLPPFLAAAADGDLDALRKCVDDDNEPRTNHADDDKSKSQPIDRKRQEHIRSLLSLWDRNGSTAEHWAAGGGYIHCVSYLLELRDMVSNNISDTTSNAETSEGPTKRIRRRRDGKTSLHYAARNGHNGIIDLLLSRSDAIPVDLPSGDGTTPLHLACYGGHPLTVKHLVETHHANIFALNEWECGSSHWAAMSLGKEGPDKVIELCQYLKERGVDFAARQKQGHSPLHKAASRKNRDVIEWLAKSCTFSEEERISMGLPDVGGNRPSDIWGGEKEFGLWMKDKCGW